MHAFITGHFELVLCFLILLARAGDIGSTFLATPKLVLEANPIMRRLGWWFAPLTLLVCLVPFYSTAIGVVLLVPSLFVSASNISKIWVVRAYGELEYRELLYRLARKSKKRYALAGVAASSSFIGLAGGVLLYLSPDPDREWGYWFALGLLGYAFAICLHRSLFVFRIFRIARRIPEEGAIVT